MRCDPLDSQLAQRSCNLRLGLGPRIVGLPASCQGGLKHTRLVGLHRLRPAVALQITPQYSQVLVGRVDSTNRARRALVASSIIPTRYISAAPIFQPGMHAGVPLHQLASTFPARPPTVHLGHARPFGLPDPAPTIHFRNVSLPTRRPCSLCRSSAISSVRSRGTPVRSTTRALAFVPAASDSTPGL